MSLPVTVGPREPVTALVRERVIKDSPVDRGRSQAPERSPKVTIGRLDIQVINQSAHKASENMRTPISGTHSEEFDSIGRRLLGRFDLI